MEKTKLSLSALVGAVATSAVFLIVDGKTTQVELVDDVSAMVEVKDADKDALLAEASRAEAGSSIACDVGVISNYPERCYCTDGVNAGWFTEASACRSVAVVDGKVYEKT